jgi:hypothetical protein
MAYETREDRCGCGRSEISVANRGYDVGISRAVRARCRDTWFRLLQHGLLIHQFGASVCAVLAAADGKPILGVTGERKCGRDQREAEEQYEERAEETPHTVSIEQFSV